MILYKQKKDIQAKIASLKKEQKTIGFVPTMGALHGGHITLINASREQNDITICSIFINPTQFNDSNDFKKYPVTIESDILQLSNAHTDILFLPSVDEMYPDGISSLQHYKLGDLETVLEGKYRPGHFQGVCNVVNRLFNIIQPHKAYFGQKDYQQCLVIKRLVQLQQLPITIVVHPTVRENNGLAMSSRNLRLSEAEKNKAAALYQALIFIKENIQHSDIEMLKQKVGQIINKAGFEKLDYIEIADAETLQPVQKINDSQQSVALVAAFLHEVRLIDNLLL